MPLSSGGLTNILHGLAARGLILRLPDPSDHRGVLIQMTPEAVKLIDLAIAAHVAEEHRTIMALPLNERRVLENSSANFCSPSIRFPRRSRRDCRRLGARVPNRCSLAT